MTKVPSAPVKTVRSTFSSTLCATTRAPGTDWPAGPLVTPRRTTDVDCPRSSAPEPSAAICNAIDAANAAVSNGPRFTRLG